MEIAMHPAFQRLFERHVASSFDKQLYLADLIGEHDWQLDLDRGFIEFGGRGPWRIQVLGTASKRTGTWLWAWAIRTIQIPVGLLKVAEGMRRLGETVGAEELTNFEQPRGEQTGTRLAMATAGMFKADAFYRAPYSGGALYLLLADPAYPRATFNPAERIPVVLPQVFARFPEVDQRQVLDGYLAHYGLASQPDGSDVVILNGSGPLLHARFDEENRLTAIDPAA